MILAGSTTIDLENALSGTGFAKVAGYTVPKLISTGLNLLFVAAAVVSFIFLIVGGIQWITAGGEKDNLDKARKKITGAVIGLAIVLSVYAIATIVDIIFFGGAGGIFVLKIPTL